jgi:hypothetical protein
VSQGTNMTRKRATNDIGTRESGTTFHSTAYPGASPKPPPSALAEPPAPPLLPPASSFYYRNHSDDGANGGVIGAYGNGISIPPPGEPNPWNSTRTTTSTELPIFAATSNKMRQCQPLPTQLPPLSQALPTAQVLPTQPSPNATATTRTATAMVREEAPSVKIYLTPSTPSTPSVSPSSPSVVKDSKSTCQTCCIKGCPRRGTRLLTSLRGNYELKEGEHSGRVCEGHYRKDLRTYKKKYGGKLGPDDIGIDGRRQKRKRKAARKSTYETSDEEEDAESIISDISSFDDLEDEEKAVSSKRQKVTITPYATENLDVPETGSAYSTSSGTSRPKRNKPKIKYEDTEVYEEVFSPSDQQSETGEKEEEEEDSPRPFSALDVSKRVADQLWRFNMFCEAVLQASK